MPYKICVVTGTRADYGLLKRLLFRLKLNNDVDLELLVTGSHLSDLFGNTQQEILEDGFNDYIKVNIPLNDDSKGGMANATGEAICAFSRCFLSISPHIMVVLGDRYEAFASAIAARMQGIPVAHISGGDVTEGAIDDSIRHSITKMSQIHFPGCEQSRRRIIQMGEQPDSVFNVGEPGVENCLKTPLLSTNELSESISFDGVRADYSIVTYHPVTLENNTGVHQVKELIRAMESFPNMNFIITMANADAGGREINDIWIEEGKKHDNWLIVASLGVVRYLSAMKYAKAVIGNSSSGVVEAPSMGVPTVNIGDRQKGRMIANSVINCEPICDEIIKALKLAYDDSFQEKSKQVVSLFGAGNTSEKIEKYILNYLNNNHLTTEKSFYDIEFDSEILN